MKEIKLLGGVIMKLTTFIKIEVIIDEDKMMEKNWDVNAKEMFSDGSIEFGEVVINIKDEDGKIKSISKETTNEIIEKFKEGIA